MTWSGTGIGSGHALGPTRVLRHQEPTIREIEPSTPKLEMDRLEEALEHALRQLREDRQHMSKKNQISMSILDTHIAMIEDPVVWNDATDLISNEAMSAETAYHRVMQEHVKRLEEHDDARFRERAEDLKDVETRVLSALSGIMYTSKKEINENEILLVDRIYPSDVMAAYQARAAGIVVVHGSATAHATILARGFGLPMVIGVDASVLDVIDGTLALLNGEDGLLQLHPSEELQHQSLMSQSDNIIDHSIPSGPTYCADGERIIVRANLAQPHDLIVAKAHGAEGVGLYRTEYLASGLTGPMGETEQIAQYQTLLDAYPTEPVVIRIYDLGGDKPLHGVTIRKDNPFLGLRGIRLYLQHPELAKPQLRALLQCQHGGNLHVMLPMVSIIEELDGFRSLLHECETELQTEQKQINPFRIGIMVETPAVALLADQFAKHVDFMSIGTNDLTQYVMAVSRTNESVSKLYQSYHPAVLRLIKQVVQACENQGIWVGVCGEIAAEPMGSSLLVGLGVKELSMSPYAIESIRKHLSIFNYVNLVKIANKCLQMSTEKDIIKYLNSQFQKEGQP